MSATTTAQTIDPVWKRVAGPHQPCEP